MAPSSSHSPTPTAAAGSSAAERALRDLVNDVSSAPRRTLAHWRLQSPSIASAIEEFAAGPEWSRAAGPDDDRLVVAACQAEVQEVFDRLNSVMLDQEGRDWPDGLSSRRPGPNDVLSVVLGGKAPPRGAPARSISEKLVQILSDDAESASSGSGGSGESSGKTRVITVSRSEIPPEDLPDNVQHFAMTHLDDDATGSDEFEEVLRAAIGRRNEQRSSPEGGSDGVGPPQTLALYFTLGAHKGVDPFGRNVAAAKNFAAALRRVAKDLTAVGHGCRFRVVVTGTDATNPRTFPDGTVRIDGEDYECPSYRIEDRKFVYAISKLCQYYVIADAVAEILVEASASSLGAPEMDVLLANLKRQIRTMSRAVDAAGEDGTYRESLGISRDELDRISADWDAIERALSPHVMMARGISIAYTPLHGNAWVREALDRCRDADKEGGSEPSFSPKAYLVRQIVPRLKNAISIDKAALTHFAST